ncbi:MAG: addiction module toxin RelE [Alphaproteobacteria bacterium RIFOXYD12_FULL_60_8]|nr:MAG: addiction module toxin RelE [Alphaproteobacteria bacterium RIFOXYD12_FULL_60_8]
MRIIVAPTFSRAVKRLHKNQKADLDNAVRQIAENPLLGAAKVGDLSGVRVFKFHLVNQLCLLAYTQPDDDTLKLLALGAHENFYRDMKR